MDELKNWVSIAVIHPDDLADVIANTGRTEIDLMAELDDGTLLFGGCKWRTERVTRLNDLSLRSAVSRRNCCSSPLIRLNGCT